MNSVIDVCASEKAELRVCKFEKKCEVHIHFLLLQFVAQMCVQYDEPIFNQVVKSVELSQFLQNFSGSQTEILRGL